MSTLIVVPARYASSRFPGKPLAELTGASGVKKSLIQRSWEAAMAVATADVDVVVATDDDRIRDAARAFGADVVMTSASCQNGTERCADAINNIDKSYDLVVNLQGDAPLSPAWFVEELIASFDSGHGADMVTPVLLCDSETVQAFQADRAAGQVGGTTAVFDDTGRALYFSKEVLPYADDPATQVYHHVGIYAYRPAALRDYLTWPTGPLETAEGLEQLRFLENGRKIHCQLVDGKGRAFWEVNNPSDIERVNGMLQKLGIE
ncbi:3-deoxy-manno-octulosonate cytidylyltransferase [Amylibacter marinus]|uniref:3-deoxy-manno-octulosonate cytidylyltransferase n=1 Tax=Amylibacter marinus TaxID=1475483 RepID=A0ABQ5VW47_9RHOB|nr:manno-octulosonate cytidylyltransferase [Amylibacter marinus]GLQ35508.1 3-deoxy-manno-octulosonate cytidylyltransferase [Amylibacter marinus]